MARSMGLAGRYRNELGLVLAIAAVVGVTLAFSGDYLREPTRNLQDILRETSLLGIFALGAAIVIISGGIDLSAGSVIVFSGSACCLTMLLLSPRSADGAPDPTALGWGGVLAAIGATMLVGLMIGTLHAWLITVIRLPPFVATLASLVGLRSLAKVLNQAVTQELGNQQTKVRADAEAFEVLAAWWVPLVVFLALGALCWLLMSRMIVGRHLYALGGNEEAARLSGIRTDRLKWFAYSVSAVLSSVAGVLYAAKIGAVDPSTLAVGYELNAIAASVVGGCSLQGGLGTIPGVMLGVLFLRVVIDAVAKIVRANSDDYQGMIVGFLVVLAVAFNELQRGGFARRKQFFPGRLGLAAVPVLSLIVGAIFFVMADKGERIRVGAIAAVSTLALLGVLKAVESRRAA